MLYYDVLYGSFLDHFKINFIIKIVSAILWLKLQGIVIYILMFCLKMCSPDNDEEILFYLFLSLRSNIALTFELCYIIIFHLDIQLTTVN